MLEICIQTSYDQNVQLILKSYLPVVYGTPLRNVIFIKPKDHLYQAYPIVADFFVVILFTPFCIHALQSLYNYLAFQSIDLEGTSRRSFQTRVVHNKLAIDICMNVHIYQYYKDIKDLFVFCLLKFRHIQNYKSEWESE